MKVHFDYRTRLWFLLAATAFIFTLVNPAWHFLDLIMAVPTVGLKIVTVGGVWMIVIWGVTGVATGIFTAFTSVVIPKFYKFFLGREIKGSDENDEVFFYVLMTMFTFGLCLLFIELQSPVHYDTKKNLQKLCGLLQNDTRKEIQDICNPQEDPDPPEDPYR